MTTTEWLWLAFALVGPLPLVWLWRWHVARRNARRVRDTMAYRRQKFGGFVAVPGVGPDGQRKVLPVARPDKEA